MSQDQWDQRFLNLAVHVACWSKDPSTRVGAVIVGPDREILTTGYNGFPRGVNDDPERLIDRDTKLLFTDHAERNCVNHAARTGVRLKGATAYVTAPPCAGCARALIQAGITRVVYAPPPPGLKQRWAADFNAAETMFKEAGISLTELPAAGA